MTERLGKRVSRSITFYPTPEDNDLLEALDRQAEAEQITFSELCKLALRQFAGIPYPYTVTDRELQQQIQAELTAQGVSFSDWVKQKLHASPPVPPDLLEVRLQRLEQIVSELQQRPVPLSRSEIEQLIQHHLSPGTPEKSANLAPPKPTPATDPLLAELGALLVEDF
ncbi:MAG: hypothetical protein Q6K90_01265 [Gloeomargarita sp. HHBFW_bins_162]